jgi:hypothetical protein
MLPFLIFIKQKCLNTDVKTEMKNLTHQLTALLTVSLIAITLTGCDEKDKATGSSSLPPQSETTTTEEVVSPNIEPSCQMAGTEGFRMEICVEKGKKSNSMDKIEPPRFSLGSGETRNVYSALDTRDFVVSEINLEDPTWGVPDGKEDSSYLRVNQAAVGQEVQFIPYINGGGEWGMTNLIEVLTGNTGYNYYYLPKDNAHDFNIYFISEEMVDDKIDHDLLIENSWGYEDPVLSNKGGETLWIYPEVFVDENSLVFFLAPFGFVALESKHGLS